MVQQLDQRQISKEEFDQALQLARARHNRRLILGWAMLVGFGLVGFGIMYLLGHDQPNKKLEGPGVFVFIGFLFVAGIGGLVLKSSRAIFLSDAARLKSALLPPTERATTPTHPLLKAAIILLAILLVGTVLALFRTANH